MYYRNSTRTICIDFDGVLHNYKNGFKGPRNIPDAPVDGAIEWLRRLLLLSAAHHADKSKVNIGVAIYSTRSRYLGGRRAMKLWLEKWGMSKEEIKSLGFPSKKPRAFFTIDDRAFCFRGTFPETDDILRFTTWQNRSVDWNTNDDSMANRK